MKAAAFDYHRARDVPDALAALSGLGDDARPIAGGCSLGPMLNLRLARPSALVDLRALGELRQVSKSETGLVIGACWTHAEIEDGAVPDPTQGLMRRVARGIAYRPVRNRGTLGGSLAHADPAADWVTTMLALDAVMIVQGAQGQRRVGAGAFNTGAYATAVGPQELLVAIEVPALTERARFGYHKICRKTGEFANAIGAAVLDPARDLARVVCGAAERSPVAMPVTSAALSKGPAAAIESVAAEIAALFPAQDAIFRQLHAVAVERAIRELAA